MQYSLGASGVKTTMRVAAKLAAIVGLGMLALSGPATSQTVTPQSVDPVQHFLDCFGVLVSDPDVHAAQCGPGHEFFLPGPSSGTPCQPLADDAFDDVYDDTCYSSSYEPPPP